jgi:hypothetical protein
MDQKKEIKMRKLIVLFITAAFLAGAAGLAIAGEYSNVVKSSGSQAGPAMLDRVPNIQPTIDKQDNQVTQWRFQKSYTDTKGRVGTDTVSVPEPAAILLLGVGMIGVAVAGRRFNKKK